MPVSDVPRGAAVVWISHCWGGTPARPDDQANTKAKAIYEGLKVIKRFWFLVLCLLLRGGVTCEWMPWGVSFSRPRLVGSVC